MLRVFTTVTVFILGLSAAFAEDVSLPSVIKGEVLNGGVFETFPATVQKLKDKNGELEMRYATVDSSQDKKLTIGVSESEPVEITNTKGYPVDEVMFFAKGGVILTNEDGSITEVGPGDTLTLPKGWKGHWSSPEGYRKIYVVYSSSDTN